ncbi:hypothetical protein [Hyphomicrobium sp.]|uniref:hypothetical protein n=1 Tax=Hyphomicrobium sp. TaxID=82 RepID=UPI001DDD8DE8|nr:hypothetical protein [Hyphomicrobium sp.]MBY0561499.1 hypothetical protein [Hyphomicrobium sp.]
MELLKTLSIGELNKLHAECLAWAKQNPRRTPRPNRLPRHTLTRAHNIDADIIEIEAELATRVQRRKSRRVAKHSEAKAFA